MTNVEKTCSNDIQSIKVAVSETIVDADDVEAIANKTRVKQETLMPDEFVETPDDNSKMTEDDMDEKRHLDSAMPWDGSSNPGPLVPFGVRSFADLDAAEAAEEATDEVREDSEKMVKIVRNILNDPDDDSKAASIAKVATEFSDRVADRSDQMKSGNGLLTKVAEIIREAIDENKLNADHNKQNCKTEGGVCYPSKDYAFVPDSEKPSTWKLRLSQGKPGNITKSQLGRAAAAFSTGGFRGKKVKIPSGNVSQVKARIRREYKKLGVPIEEVPESVKALTSFMVFKEKSGRYAWLAKYSNSFRDDDSPPEIISSKSHQDFTAAVHVGKHDYPTLRLWHRPEWEIGKSTWLAWDDTGDGTGFALAAGYFNDGMENVAKSLAKAQDLGVSHGMPKQYLRRDPDDRTIITQHVTKEISVLPLWAAANRWTEFIPINDVNKENDMGIPEDLKEQAQDTFGLDDNVIAQIEEANKKSASKNRELGVDFKEKGGEDTEEVETSEAADADTTDDANAKDGVDPDGTPTRKEVADAFIAIQSKMIKQVTETVSANLAEQLTPLINVVKELGRSDDERMRESLGKTPRISSLTDMMNQSLIGTKESGGISEKEAADLGKPSEAEYAGEGSFIKALTEGKGDEYLNEIMDKSAEPTK